MFFGFKFGLEHAGGICKFNGVIEGIGGLVGCVWSIILCVGAAKAGLIGIVFLYIFLAVLSLVLGGVEMGFMFALGYTISGESSHNAATNKQIKALKGEIKALKESIEANNRTTQVEEKVEMDADPNKQTKEKPELKEKDGTEIPVLVKEQEELALTEPPSITAGTIINHKTRGPGKIVVVDSSGMCVVCWSDGTEGRINIKKAFEEGLLLQ